MMHDDPSAMDKAYDALFGDGGLLKVRAILAFMLTGACIFLWIDTGNVPDALLATAGPAIGYYFASRQT
jgi:hypothetical protein